MIRLKNVTLPEFGTEKTLPPIPAAEYEQRLDAVVEEMLKRKLDFLIVYADREHSANMAFLTGYDPRFEEAILLLDTKGSRTLVVGNEGLAYVPAGGPRMHVVMFQEFSLLGQPRDKSPTLRRLLSDFGIGRKASIGCAGWKYFYTGNVEGGNKALEIPAYLVDTLRDMAGGRDRVTNVTDLFMDPTRGLRSVNSATQIAQFEFAAIAASEAVQAVIRNLREGVTEREMAQHLRDMGLPHSCHAVISFGDKVKCGPASPCNVTARRGDAILIGFGLWGALTARAGAIAAGPEDLPAGIRDFYGKFVANYFDMICAWFETVRVGARACDVVKAVEKRRSPALLSLALNPGHTIHLDEWVHSPFVPGNKAKLVSGMALQSDLIPVSAGPFVSANAEDGIALADEKLCDEIGRRFPACWKRIAARQEFVRETIGIPIHDSVLPLSNTPCVFAPYFLSPDKLLVRT